MGGKKATLSHLYAFAKIVFLKIGFKSRVLSTIYASPLEVDPQAYRTPSLDSPVRFFRVAPDDY